MEYFIYKYNFCLKIITNILLFYKALLNHFIGLTKLLWTVDHSPQSNILRILPTFPNFWECAEEKVQKCFSIRNIIFAYKWELKIIYNGKHFLKVLYFFLNKTCSTCSDDNWSVSVEITLMHSCSSNLM